MLTIVILILIVVLQLLSIVTINFYYHYHHERNIPSNSISVFLVLSSLSSSRLFVGGGGGEGGGGGGYYGCCRTRLSLLWFWFGVMAWTGFAGRTNFAAFILMANPNHQERYHQNHPNLSLHDITFQYIAYSSNLYINFCSCLQKENQENPKQTEFQSRTLRQWNQQEWPAN